MQEYRKCQKSIKHFSEKGNGKKLLGKVWHRWKLDLKEIVCQSLDGIRFSLRVVSWPCQYLGCIHNNITANCMMTDELEMNWKVVVVI